MDRMAKYLDLQERDRHNKGSSLVAHHGHAKNHS